MFSQHPVPWYRLVMLFVISVLIIPVYAIAARDTDESCLAVKAGDTYTLTSDETRCCVKIHGTVVTNGHQLTVTDQGGLRIHNEGTLLIDGAVVLQAGGSCIIDGDFKLSASGARLSVQQDTTFIGSGSILGSDDAAKIAISAGKIFTSQVDLKGAMQIDGLSSLNPGTLKLDGGAVLHAGGWVVAGGVIEFMANSILDDSGTSDAELFKASNGGKLRFSRTATNLDAAFEINGGVFDFDQNITTTGSFTCSSPTIEVATEKAFIWHFGSMDEDSLDDSGSPYTSCP